jgi:peptidoglycan hydrolase-like protein with peptidoglycan-binding domain
MAIQNAAAARTTTAKAVALSSPSGEGAQHKTVKKGDRGPDVVALQTEMRSKGVYSGPITGYFGSRTDEAVRGFQRSKGLVVDGIVGPKTWKALDSMPDKPGTAPAPSTGSNGKPAGWFPPPVGIDAIKARYGEAGQNIVTARLPLGAKGADINVRINKNLLPVLEPVLREAKEKGLLEGIRSFGGAAIEPPRLKRKPDGTIIQPPQPSLHSWGIAFDLNPDKAGGKVDPRLVEFLKSKGFTWGGDFKDNYDPMHFQYASGY